MSSPTIKKQRKLSDAKTNAKAERQRILSPEGKAERQLKIHELKGQIMHLQFVEETALREEHEEAMQERMLARASMPEFQLEAVRAGVKMASTIQAGQKKPALDGDGHTIKNISLRDVPAPLADASTIEGGEEAAPKSPRERVLSRQSSRGKFSDV